MLGGTWIPTTAELGGQALPENDLQSMKLVLSGEHYTVLAGNVKDEGTITFDTAKRPNTMDIKGTEGPNKGKTILAIYEQIGDSLRVCYDVTGENRPTEFSTQGNSNLFLVTYRRTE